MDVNGVFSPTPSGIYSSGYNAESYPYRFFLLRYSETPSGTHHNDCWFWSGFVSSSNDTTFNIKVPTLFVTAAIINAPDFTACSAIRIHFYTDGYMVEAHDMTNSEWVEVVSSGVDHTVELDSVETNGLIIVDTSTDYYLKMVISDSNYLTKTTGTITLVSATYGFIVNVPTSYVNNQSASGIICIRGSKAYDKVPSITETSSALLDDPSFVAGVEEVASDAAEIVVASAIDDAIAEIKQASNDAFVSV